jgi:enoyl-CoA hydratase
MGSPVTYSRSGSISRIVMDDGKVNVMSIEMLEALHSAFKQAEKDGAVVIFGARGKHFSAGFDLKVLTNGTADDILKMLTLGAELALRILSFPRPVVAACHGNAFPMGAFLILSSDLRFAADGAYKIGMNEVAIGLTLPLFAVEVARQRLTPAYFNRAAVTGEMFGPAEAVTAGFFDCVVPASELETHANQTAEALTKIDMAAHAGTKLRVREQAIKAIRAAIDAEYTPAFAEARVAARSAKA